MHSKIINKKIIEFFIVNQKSILIMFGSIFAALFIFWVFIFIPKKERLETIKSDYYAMQAEIDNIEAIAGGADNIEDAIKKFNETIAMLNQKIPTSEEKTVKDLSFSAKQNDIEVTSLSPQPLKISPVQGNIPGLECKELKIDMNLTCTFKNLGKYLFILQNEFPALIRIDRLEIKKAKPEDKNDPSLEVRLILKVYLLHKKIT